MSTPNPGDSPPEGTGNGPPAPIPGGTPAAPEPRSPRPTPPTLADLPPGFMGPPGPPPRPNIGSMLFLTAFFFFMSGNNNIPAPIQVGPDGEFIPRVTELDKAREYVSEYTGFLNGTGNWTEPSTPQLLPDSILPSVYSHSNDQSFFTNISGFYRDARLHPVDLLSSTHHIPHFFHDISIPHLNTSSSPWNETLSSGLLGDFPWSHVVKWDMNLKERSPTQSKNYTSPTGTDDWTWVKGVASISTAEEEDTIEYNLYGLHHVPNGTYGMWGLPDGMRVDIRHIPVSWGGHENATRDIILGELEKELQVQEDSMYLVDVKEDDETRTRCPLLVHFTVPPIPLSSSLKDVELYESEMHEPTGIKVSLPRPPNYWEGIGIGGVIIADQCGWAFGMEGGTGVKIDEFWSRSINYAALATASQLLVLLLLVRQIERTRTPSALAKVSVWTIVIMGITDSWVFSAHVVVGIMSDNKTSLPLLVPGFLCLCSAIVFGPRYAVMLHRIQAPERAAPRPAIAPAPPTATTPAPSSDAADSPLVIADLTPPRPSLTARLRAFSEEHPGVRVLLGIVLVLIGFQFALMPSIVPFFLCIMYSFWIPQIWRNARRGSNDGMDKKFIIGTAAGRLVLPLYVFGYDDNVFFIRSTSWIWSLVIWQSAQVVVLLAQQRFGAAFFLPKRFQPAEMYNYHPLLPPPDAENPTTKEDERTCSICMEEVDIRPGPSGEVLLGINPRRGYALAPCHHLFHTKCLSQWLAIKSICPLCKRSLPPL